jgi:hypothetical protein
MKVGNVYRPDELMMLRVVMERAIDSLPVARHMQNRKLPIASSIVPRLASVILRIIAISDGVRLRIMPTVSITSSIAASIRTSLHGDLTRMSQKGCVGQPPILLHKHDGAGSPPP